MQRAIACERLNAVILKGNPQKLPLMLKYCALFSLCACASLAQSFVTGQAARLVIGQSTFTSQTAGASDTLLGAIGGLAFGGDTLFVADSNRLGLSPINNRVLMYQNISASLPGPLAEIPAYSGRCPVCVGQANLVLGQPDFLSTTNHSSQAGLRLPTAVATDGRYLAIADTENNRVMLYNSIPTYNGQPADIVLGQPDFNTVKVPVTSASSFRGPQGVWISNGRLFVADTQNNRILIWKSMPTQNNQPADLVLGQADFTSVISIPVNNAQLSPSASSMLNPVSVTSDGTRVFVADLAYNRVLIWNSIPTQNNQPADLELGQKDFVSALPDDVTRLCPQAGTDSNGNPLYPALCGRTLNYPRFALSDGKRLYVADGGNDRVLVFETIPTANDPEADEVLGQTDEYASVVTSTTSLFNPLLQQSASDVTPTPTSLAWDGTNLYVTDPSNRRILVFTPESPNIPINGVHNGASLEAYATGQIDIGGTISAGDTLTIHILNNSYTYTILSTDTLTTVVQNVVNAINAGSGDPNVLATVQTQFNQVELTARQGGPGGNNISYNATESANAQISAVTANPTLSGGQAASVLAPGTRVTVFGMDLADTPPGGCAADTTQPLPIVLCGVEVYFDGIRSPMSYVSATQINMQIPWEVSDSNSTSFFVRTVHQDGTVTATTAVGVPITEANPGIFAFPGPDPRTAIAYHGSSAAIATVTISGGVNVGDVATLGIEDRTYNYTVQSTDTLQSIRDALILLINSNPDERVIASAGQFAVRVILTAKVRGPEGDGIAISAMTNNSTGGSSLSLFNSNDMLCCASVAGAPITPENPAVPGEEIYVYATGLGLVSDTNGNLIGPLDGAPYNGPVLNAANTLVSSLIQGVSGDVLTASLLPGGIGIYQVYLELGAGTPGSAQAQVTISQDIYNSNIVLIPIGNPTEVPTN